MGGNEPVVRNHARIARFGQRVLPEKGENVGCDEQIIDEREGPGRQPVANGKKHPREPKSAPCGSPRFLDRPRAVPRAGPRTRPARPHGNVARPMARRPFTRLSGPGVEPRLLGLPPGFGAASIAATG